MIEAERVLKERNIIERRERSGGTWRLCGQLPPWECHRQGSCRSQETRERTEGDRARSDADSCWGYAASCHRGFINAFLPPTSHPLISHTININTFTHYRPQIISIIFLTWN